MLAVLTGLGEHIPELIQLTIFVSIVVGSYWLVQLKLSKLEAHLCQQDGRIETLEDEKDNAHASINEELRHLDATKMNKDACLATHSGLQHQMALLTQELRDLRSSLDSFRRSNGIANHSGR